MNIKKSVLLSGLLPVLFLAACGPSTFIVTKDGYAGYFGRDQAFLRTLLCVRGDLEAVLASAVLPEEIKSDFRRYVCSEERSYDKVLSLYLFLTPDEKKSLKSAFEKQGYEINNVHC